MCWRRYSTLRSEAVTFCMQNIPFYDDALSFLSSGVSAGTVFPQVGYLGRNKGPMHFASATLLLCLWNKGRGSFGFAQDRLFAPRSKSCCGNTVPACKATLC